MTPNEALEWADGQDASEAKRHPSLVVKAEALRVLAAEVRALRQHGYVLAMRLMQSELIRDEAEQEAIEAFCPPPEAWRRVKAALEGTHD